MLVYGLNSANPMVGSETLAQNSDHFNTFTEYSLKQILEVSGYSRIKTLPLKLYGKNVRILSKKIAAIAYAGS